VHDQVRYYCQSKLMPRVLEANRKEFCDPEIFREMGAVGMLGSTIQGYGCAGVSSVAYGLTAREVERVDSGYRSAMSVQSSLVMWPIYTYGTEEQKQKYLPKLCTETVGSFCLSEWGSGSDAFALKSTAIKTGHNYILNGTKAWITNSKEAGLFIIFANTDLSKGYKGITTFLVSKDNPGIKIGKKEDKMGLRASSTCEVQLTDCVVSHSDVLGEVGKGYKYAIETLNEGRIGIAAQMCGLAQGVLDHTMPYLMQRKQFGQTIASFQGVRFDYAWIATWIEAARLLTYNAARLQEEGKPFAKEAAMAKLYSSEIAVKAASKCVEMLGGVGFTKEMPVEKYYRDCKIGQIYEGTTNIHLDTIGKLVHKEYE